MVNMLTHKLPATNLLALNERHMKTLFAVISAAAFISPAASQTTPPAGPIFGLTARLLALEKKVADLQVVAGKRKVVDSRGVFMANVISDSPTSALVEIPFRGGTRKLVLGFSGIMEGPAYSRRFFLSLDCSGPAYSMASRFDGSLDDGSLWGKNFLWRNSLTGEFEYPRAGATANIVTINSFSSSSGRCFPSSESISAYPQTDLEKIDPFAGYLPPYRIVQ